MTESRGGRSLFWTIASMLVVAVAVGTAAQWLIASAVLQPLEARDARSRSELTAARLASELSGPAAPTTDADVESLLAHHRLELGLRPSWVAYRNERGDIVSDPPGRGRLIADLTTPGRATTPGRTTTPAPPGFKREILARHPVVRAGATVGEVLIVRPVRTGGPSSFFDSLTSLFYLPLAVLASAIVGLIMVRLLVRRLKALEVLATRVSQGDLSARVADRSGDEIGRVAERLDLMIDRLAEARDRLEANEQQRRRLFANITHELATPLTSIRGYAETLLDPSVPISPEERDRYLRGIQEEAGRLDRLTRDLFELARLEAGATQLTLEPLDWAALCRNTIERFEPRFRAAGLALAWRGPLDEAWVEADGHRLEQVLENLLSNALRYVPDGGIVQLRLERASIDGGEGYRLAVEDDGPGLAPEAMTFLFDRFYRAPGSRPARPLGRADGSGLGLAIVREIVEQHGGSVVAGARDPRGLSIRVTLPAKAKRGA